LNLLYKSIDSHHHHHTERDKDILASGQTAIQHYINTTNLEKCLEWGKIPFLYSLQKQKSSSNYLGIKLGDTWSKPINIDTVGMIKLFNSILSFD
jgi:hypothetical protein